MHTFKRLSLSSKKLKTIAIFSVSTAIYYKISKNQYLLYSKQQNDDEEMTSTERIKGEYENRIRIFSPIEKKYSIFGKIKNKSQQMDYYQFFDSLIPYQGIKLYSGEENMTFFENNKEFQSILKKVDTNEDKSISIEEYLVLCYLTSSKINIIILYYNISFFS